MLVKRKAAPKDPIVLLPTGYLCVVKLDMTVVISKKLEKGATLGKNLAAASKTLLFTDLKAFMKSICNIPEFLDFCHFSKEICVARLLPII